MVDDDWQVGGVGARETTEVLRQHRFNSRNCQSSVRVDSARASRAMRGANRFSAYL